VCESDNELECRRRRPGVTVCAVLVSLTALAAEARLVTLRTRRASSLGVGEVALDVFGDALLCP
jgi:hypothetical protein